MDKENFRKNLIYLLKTSKLYYYDKGNTQRIYNGEEKSHLLSYSHDKIADLKLRKNVKENILQKQGNHETFYNTLISDEEKNYLSIYNSKVIYLTEDASLESIANQIKVLSLK